MGEDGDGRDLKSNDGTARPVSPPCMVRPAMSLRPVWYGPPCLSALYPHSLNQPNGHHMRRVFESFLDLLMGVTRDTFEQPTFDVGTMLEMPELHLQSIADMSCFYALYVRAAAALHSLGHPA